MANRRQAECLEHRFVSILEAVASVDQHVDAGKIGASAQVCVDQLSPGSDFSPGSGGVAVAWHVHDLEAPAAGKEDQLLGAPGGARDARQRLAAGESVDQGCIADV